MDDIKKIAFLIITLSLMSSSITSFGQSCNILSKANDMKPDRLCAPVTANWKVIYRGVDDGGTGNVEFEFDWDDGNPPVRIPAINDSLQTWSVITNHVYPVGGNKCNYHPTVILIVDGQSCSSSIQEQIVTVWDTDDQNGGEMNISPDVFPICYGNDGTVTFTDVSQWNCTPPDENDVPNSRRRWVQWIYGTGGTNITTAEVNGVIESYPFSGSINMTTEPILGPTAPFNQTLPIYIPAGYNVGDFFEVTLRNWNYCNPYDDPNKPGPPSDPVNGDFDPVEITAIAIIVALPDGTIAAVGPFCENEPSVDLNAATPGGMWSGPGIVNSTNGTFDPATAGPGLHTINYDVTNSDGCSATGTTTIQVWDAPVADISVAPATYLCPGVNVTLDGNPSEGTTPYTHQWTGDTSPLDDTSVQTPNFNTMTTGVYTLYYEVTDTHSCSDKDTIDMHVYPVNIHFNNKDLDLCTNILDTLKPEPSGGSGVYSTHLWSGTRTDLLSATGIENPTFMSPNEGLFKYKYSVTDNQGCSTSDSVFVHVYEQPFANAGVNDTVCELTNILNATPSAGIGTWSLISGSGSLSFSDVNAPDASVTADTYGSYTLEWSEDNNSCIDADTVTLVFFKTPAPVAAADGDTCGMEYTINVTPDLGTGYWQQRSGPGTATFDSTTDTTTNVSVNIGGDYVFEWIEANSFGCTGSDGIEVSFHVIPVAAIAPFDTSGCSPVNIDFVNSSTDANTYYWNFGDGYIANEKDPSHTFKNINPTPDTMNIKMIAYNTWGCTDTTSEKLIVYPSPMSSFNTDKGPGCSPLTINFTNQSAGADTYLWNLGDGTPDLTDEDITHTFLNNEQYVQAFPVTLTVENSFGCTDTSDAYVTVYPLSNFTLTVQPDSGCHPLRVDFLSDPGAYSYNWVFGDGQSMPGSNTMSHVYENKGSSPVVYNAILYTSSVFGCLDTTTVDIKVNPSPESKFSYTPNNGCAPLGVKFTNQSLNTTSSLWKFGDGTEETFPGDSSTTHIYQNDDFYQKNFKVVLSVENQYGCIDSSGNFISVYPKVNAVIETPDNGCSPHSTSLINSSTGANKFFWDFGDGNTSTDYTGSNIFINNSTKDTTYNIVLTTTSPYGCVDADTTSVTVYRVPKPDFIADPLEQQLPNSTVTVTNNTPGNYWDYTWLWGDGSISTDKDPDLYTYDRSGDFDIKLIVAGEHCSDSTIRSVTILSTMPAIIYGADTAGCPPLNVQFYNHTKYANTFMWEFGDGGVSSEKEPEHTYMHPGEYKVKLTVYGPGGTTEKEDVTVNVFESPKAYFEAVPSLIKIPGQSVSFLNKSEGADSSFWDLGDGYTTTDFSFMYEYKEAGTYDVSLEVTNEKGCKNKYVLREAVTAEKGGDISFPNAFTPNTSGPNGGRYVYGDKNNYVFYPYVQEGIDEYTLQIYTRWGELIFESNDIKIGWDGYYRGNLSPQGVYIYKATCKFGTGIIKIFTGDVTLLR